MPRVFLCDFDGTVSPSDIGAAFARRFSPGGLAESSAFLARWMSGEMGHRELTEAQCRLLEVSYDQALEFTRGFAIDPGFAPFARAARERGDQVMVLSEGFDFYVGDQLERAGLGDVPFSANRLRFESGRTVPGFPDAEGGCGQCGNCKGRHAREWRGRGFQTVLVGDGLSDRCGARAADRVVAKGTLLEWCRREGIAAEPFTGFADLAAASTTPSAAPAMTTPSAAPATTAPSAAPATTSPNAAQAR
jgi:HAD superfamily phosphoserine phosphatase-like hydrolase